MKVVVFALVLITEVWSKSCFDILPTSFSSYCDDVTERLYFGDFDGNKAIDVMCHNVVTGNIDVFRANLPAFSEPHVGGSYFCKDPKKTILHVGDFDGNGRDDLMCQYRSGGLKQIIYAKNDGSFIKKGVDWQGFGGWCTHKGSYIIVGDFNADKRADIMCHDNIGNMWISYARNGGRFQKSDWYKRVNKCNGITLTGDFNGDGRTDLLCYNKNDGRKQIRLADTKGQFAKDFDFDNEKSKHKRWCVGTTAFLTIADVNGDKRDDLVCRDQSTNTWVLINKHPYIFALDTFQFSGFCTNTPTNFFSADVNADGRGDLVCHGRTGSVQIATSMCAPPGGVK